MTTAKHIFCSLLGVLLLSASLLSAAVTTNGWTVRLEHGSLLNGVYAKGMFVDGVSTKGVTRVYINNTNQNLNAIQFTVSGNANLTGYEVTWDPNKIVIDNKLSPAYQIVGNLIKLQISGGGKTVPTEIAPSADDQLLAEIQYDITDLNADAKLGLVGTQIISAQRYNSDTDALINVKTSTAFVESDDMAVLEGFNFTVVENNPYVIDEDSETLTIDATDDEHFECTVWNGTTIAPTDEVEFSVVSFAPNTDAGSVELTTDGKIAYTPKADFNGDVTLLFTAKSTSEGVDASVDGQITITVTPVDDPPVVTIASQNIVVYEGKSFNDAGNTLELSLNVVDAEGDGLATAGDFVLYNGETEFLSGVVNVDASSDAADTYIVSLNTIGEVIPYTLIVHPETDLVLTGVLTVTSLGGEDVTVAVEGIEVTVNDVDQDVEITSFTPAFEGYSSGDATNGFEVKADTVITYTVEAEDADEEDEVTTSSYTDPAKFAMTKGFTFDAYGKATSFNGNEATSDPIHFTVINSEPVVAAKASIFICRGVATSGTCTITATDADGYSDMFTADSTGAASSSFTGTGDIAGTASTTLVQGQSANEGIITVTYTVPANKASSTVDLTDTVTIYVTDDDENTTPVPVVISIDYMENPAPVVVITADESIDEVDEDGNPASFEVTATATDSDQVLPAGVSAMRIEVPEGWTSTVVSEATYGSSETESFTCEMTWKVTCKGYGTITGSPRDASEAFYYAVYATDATTSSDGYADATITVNDVDCLPSAPTTLNPHPSEPVYGTTLSVEGAGALDDDGDAITYVYSWAVSEDEGETFEEIDCTDTSLADNSYIQKGNVVKASAKSSSDPYGTGVLVYSEEACETTWTIGNTAPWIASVEEVDATDVDADVEYTIIVDEIAEDSEEPTVIRIFADDVDVRCGKDTLTFAVTDLDEAAGSVEILEATLAYTQAPHYFNNGENMPYVIVTVKDDTDTEGTNVAKIYIQVNAKNDAPTVKGDDQYVLPDERGTEKQMTFTADMGPGEDDQEIQDAQVLNVNDPDGIFESAPALVTPVSGKSVVVKYTVKADAELGKSATFDLKVQDNGKSFDGTAEVDDPQWSEAYTVTVFVGASPWYPIISFDCVDPEAHADGHTFHLVSGEETYDLTVKGDNNTLMPADYAAAGITGFTDDSQIDVTVYVWTMEAGTTDEVCAEKDITVSAYGLPGDASSSEDAVEADEEGWVTLPEINVPMAQNYVLSVLDENGEEVQQISGDFTPNDNGIILPVVSGQQLQIAESGEYTVVVKGSNPNGEGEESEVLTITVPEDSEVVVEWTEGDFLPADGSVLTTDAVKLSWPVATNAESYTVRVYGPDGKLLEEATGLYETNYTTTKTTATEDAQTYSWYVSAVRDGQVALASNSFNVTLATATKDVIAGTVRVVAGDTNKLEIDYEGVLDGSVQVTVDCYYYSCADNMWYDNVGLAADTTTAGKLVVNLGNTVTDGDYVVLIIYVNGEPTGDSVPYMVLP